MKKFFYIVLFLLPNLMLAQRPFDTYYGLSDFLQVSPGAFKFGLYGYQNPALLNYNVSPFTLNFMSSKLKDSPDGFNRWALLGSLDKLSLGAVTTNMGDYSVTDYRTSLGFGNTKFGLGFTYGWSSGNTEYFGRQSLFALGALYRPIPELSVAASWTKSLESRNAEYVTEVAIRPIGSYPLALFADASFFDNNSLDEANWSAGISWEIIDGIRTNGRYFSNKNMAIGVDLSLGDFGVNTLFGLDNDSKNTFTTWGFRIGGNDRTIFDDIKTTSLLVRMDLVGTPTYTKYRWFDNRLNYMDIFNTIELAKKNKDVKGIFINAAQFVASKSILWEIREKLKDFKSTGKKVFIYIERADIDTYTFATIADKIYIEEMGAIALNGYMAGRSYYKNLLANIGLGFQELRYFKYKSAYENFSNEKFTEGDKEQRARLIEEYYDITAELVTSGRGFTRGKFDELVNNKMIYMGSELVNEKLVDKLTRLNKIDSLLKAENKDIDGMVPASFLYDLPEPIDDQWAFETKKIAVVIAEGACAMEGGIDARNLARTLERLYNNKNIKAIVLRVDSPGGDALASDYLAKLIRENKNKKPLIVSQGSLAASGGYWLSMDADEIVATPYTITGSIGVISAHLYDKGLSDSVGISYDYVKKGKFSDLTATYTFPIIPIGFPVRPLNDEELAQSKDRIMQLYDEFVNKVANGRKLTIEQVKEVAQGRVWSGRDGLKHKLVDRIGSLYDAIEIAKTKAGLKNEKNVEILQYPEPQLFDFTKLTPSLFGINIEKPKQEFEYLKVFFDMNSKPMTILPLDFIKMD